jgi:crossover junction endonuclease MUS81
LDHASSRQSITALQVATAKSQTQLLSGFYLKETSNMAETIQVLSLLTVEIEDKLRMMSLHVLPEDFVTKDSFHEINTQLHRLRPETDFRISFELFQSMNGKEVNLDVASTWAKMLLCVKGMSSEKVGAVLDVFPTIDSFWRALETFGTHASSLDPALFFAQAIPGEGRQKIGPALSKEVGHFPPGDHLLHTCS